MGRKLVIAVLLFILFLDLGWSFYQYYSTMLDGDMAGGIVPHEEVNKILNDPFGWEVIFHHHPHANPNRYFAHLFFKEYFLNVPQLLQYFVSPVESLYLSCALIKITVHFLLVYLITKIVTNRSSLFSLPFLVIAITISSCFQAYGYNNDIGIIDISITYTFFYALPITLLVGFIYLLLFPFKNNSSFSQAIKMSALILFTIILPFTGPLIPPVILIISFLVFLYWIFNQIINYNGIKFPLLVKEKYRIWFFITINIICLYSLYLGSFDTQYDQDQIPLGERYQRLFIGIDKLFFTKSGFSSLFQLLLFELLIITFFIKDKGQYYLKLVVAGFLFALIYIYLLPLGGYRPYRENILRYDTVMPFTIVLFLLIGIGIHILINNSFQFKISKFFYFLIIGIFIYSYQKKDWEIIYDNQKEKESLYQIAESNEEIIEIKNDCSIISWGVISDYHASEMNGKLLTKLGITKKEVRYYHPISN